MPEQKHKEYLVTWEIELSATSHEAAAEEALRIHRDKDSSATVFGVAELSEDAGELIRIDVDITGTRRL